MKLLIGVEEQGFFGFELLNEVKHVKRWFDVDEEDDRRSLGTQVCLVYLSSNFNSRLSLINVQ
jgi:hypothetical protein